jgi:hypothetical protein
MVDNGALATIASIVAAFGAAMLSFRVQRELEVRQQGERNWIPWADRLLIGATLASLWLVILPLVWMTHSYPPVAALERAACAASAIMLGGYIFALLAHYRFVWGGKQSGPLRNPEPAERLAVWVTLAVATAAFAAVFIAVHGHFNESSL